MSALPRLGAFRLERFIAAGGWGSVYLARHERSGIPTAVKTVRSPHGADDPGLRLELEALASLVHPHIVALHDFGTVEQAFQVDGMATPAQSIWIAMELGKQSLGERPPASWDEVRTTTVQLLDALAHAHARGILHRDVKPANTLWTAEGSLKLSDFGLAVVDGRTTTVAAGTNKYMAPEQQVGDLDRLGPWTDLYALGVTVWRWVCGEVPFQGRNAQQILMRKLRGNRAAFSPGLRTPSGLEGWLDGLLRVSPGDRFERAADARHALEQLGPIGRSAGHHRQQAHEDAPTEIASGRTPAEGTLPAAQNLIPPPTPLTTVLELSGRPSPPLRLLDAGLELFGLRALPTIGRDAELTLLWESLFDVHRSGRPRMALLTGSPGLGRTQLMRTFREQAHERGAAEIVTLAEGSNRALRTLRDRFGTDTDQAQARIDVLEERWGLLPSALTQALIGLIGTDDPSDRAEDVLVPLLQTWSGRRPLILCVEDAQAFAETLLEAVLGSDAPILVVATAPEGAAVPDRGQRRVRLEPLPRETHIEVCRTLLGLEPQLAARLAELSDGNPGMAVEICDHWVQTDRLRPGSRGYALVEGGKATVPEQSQWTERVHAIAPGLEARQALRAAAHLGVEVELDVLVDALRRAGLAETASLLPGLLQRLALERLVSRTPQGFGWSARSFRNAVLAAPIPASQLLASSAADALGGRRDRTLERAGALVAAERWSEAESALREQVVASDAAGHHLRVLALLEDFDRTIVEVTSTTTEAVEIARLRALRAVGGQDQLAEIVPDALALADARRWTHLGAWARLMELDLLAQQERLAAAEALVEQVCGTPREVHVEILHAAAVRNLGEGRAVRAVEHHRRAVELAAQLRLKKAAFFRVALSQSLAETGAYEEALVRIREARAEAERLRQPMAACFSWFQEGVLHLNQEDPHGALPLFERSCAIARRIGEQQEWYLRAHVGICERLSGELERARETFWSCLNAPSTSGDLLSHFGLLGIELEEEAFQRHLSFIEERWLSQGRAFGLIADQLAVAGDHQLEHGFRDRARRLYGASAEQYRRLGSPSPAVERIAERLGG